MKMTQALFMALLLLFYSGGSYGFVHQCGFGTIVTNPPAPANPTLYALMEFTAQERQQWQEWVVWSWYHNSTFSHNTMHDGFPGDYPNPFYVAYPGPTGMFLEVDSNFQFASMYWGPFGPRYEYWPPYEPDHCEAQGTPQPAQ